MKQLLKERTSLLSGKTFLSANMKKILLAEKLFRANFGRKNKKINMPGPKLRFCRLLRRILKTELASILFITYIDAQLLFNVLLTFRASCERS